MNSFSRTDIKRVVNQALKEDIGRGDITTECLISRDKKMTAVIITKEPGVICGLDIAGLVFKTLDKRIKFISLVRDGAQIGSGRQIAKISGPAKGILSAERVALNFLSLLSGIATRTQAFVKKTKPSKVKILDTRKTIPGLRGLEKYAVKAGGGFNHRFGLDDMFLIKENHIDIAGLKDIKERLKKGRFLKIKLEAEARNLSEFKDVLCFKPDIIMLDNMTPKNIRQVVKLKNKLSLDIKIEASGNINIDNIAAYASTGIDFISLGTLTKDIDALDFSLEIT